MSSPSRRVTGLSLAALLGLYAVLCLVGLTWGLPARGHDERLFGGEVWSGARIAAGAGARTDTTTGADVDVDPLNLTGGPVNLTATEADVAKIYRRYRLFTRQPDEMITIMALSGMNPRAWRFDPKLYQYGGLFIYPVGGLIGVCGLLGVYPVTGDLTYYLDHPDALGCFYLTARVYTAAWGLVGVILVFAIGRRLAGWWAGVLAGGLFALLPVVVCMAHEAKPHLPGAVLMLAAVWFAMRALDRQRNRDWAGLFITCGAATGMVLSCAPIVLLIPLAVGLHCRNQTLRQQNELPARSSRRVNYLPVFVRATLGGWLVAGAVFVLTNPYLLINALGNRAVLRSNFGNSLAMYAIDRLPAGAVRVAELTVLGATLPIALIGLVGLGLACRRRHAAALPLAAMSLLFAVQFVLLGAGKPDEYGRFGVFQDCALAIAAAAVTAATGRRSRWAGGLLAIVLVAGCLHTSTGYLLSLRADATGQGSRDHAAAQLHIDFPNAPVAVVAEPAPYACPPLPFDRTRVVLLRTGPTDQPLDVIRAVEPGPHRPGPRGPGDPSRRAGRSRGPTRPHRRSRLGPNPRPRSPLVGISKITHQLGEQAGGRPARPSVIPQHSTDRKPVNLARHRSRLGEIA
jgi:hypothetical protein